VAIAAVHAVSMSQHMSLSQHKYKQPLYRQATKQVCRPKTCRDVMYPVNLLVVSEKPESAPSSVHNTH
jgi:hypothetical protein